MQKKHLGRMLCSFALSALTLWGVSVTTAAKDARAALRSLREESLGVMLLRYERGDGGEEYLSMQTSLALRAAPLLRGEDERIAQAWSTELTQKPDDGVAGDAQDNEGTVLTQEKTPDEVAVTENGVPARTLKASIFFIEVMGRDAGFLAQNSAIAAGAEAAIIPEDSTGADQLIEFMSRGIRKSKKSCMVIVSESPKCGALYYADRVKKEYPQFDVRVSILGHLQRGGSPSARDRILASRVGVGAITALIQGQRNVMVGIRNNDVVYVPFIEAVQKRKNMDPQLIKVLDELSI